MVRDRAVAGKSHGGGAKICSTVKEKLAVPLGRTTGGGVLSKNKGLRK